MKLRDRTRFLRARAPPLLAALALAFVPVLRAAKTDPGQETVWDRVMAVQASRELRDGAGHLERREYDLAVRQFAKAVIAQPGEPAAHLMLGVAYYWTGKVEEAAAEFRETLRLDPKSGQGHLLMGIVHAWKGDVQASYRSFLEAERIDPDRSDLQMNLGSVKETLGMHQEALAHFRRAARLDAKNPLYRFQLGTLYSRLGRGPEAETELKEAIRLYPGFEDAMLELGAALEREGRRDEAKDVLAKAVKLKSRDAVARLRLARLHLLDGRPEKAREVFRDAFHLTPEEPGGGLSLSVSFGGKPAEPEAGGPGSGKPRTGRAAGSAGRKENEPRPGASPGAEPPPEEPKDPLDVLERNLQRIPLDQEAKLKVEMAFMPRPRLVRARTAEGPSSLKKALEEAGGRTLPRSAAGLQREVVLRASGPQERRARIAQAIAELREAMKKAPPDAEVRMAMNLQYSDRKGAAGPGAADAASRPGASYQPRQVGNDLGLWVMGTGWMALVEEALPEPGGEPDHPDEAAWWVADGLGYAALGQGGAALEAFDRALRRDPKDEQAWLGRAVSLVELGREREATLAYRKLLELHPGSRPAKDGLAWLLRGPASTP